MTQTIERYAALPEGTKQAVSALSVLFGRLAELPNADRDDLFELLTAWRTTDDPDERRGIQEAMEEIIAQAPVSVRPMPMPREEGLTGRLKQWVQHVGRNVRTHREAAGLTQAQLAEAADLTQSHVSRLEHADHSPTYFMLEKIAKALGVEVSALDTFFD